MKCFQLLINKHSHNTIFDNFLDMVVCKFSFGQLTKASDFKNIYTIEELSIFGDMLKELLALYGDCDTWIDPLGEIYEHIGSNYDRKAFGQFFTPEPIAQFMASMLCDEEGGEYKSFIEPSCGSGRMILAANAVRKSPIVYYSACDLDRTCVLMTAVNMLFHGIRGEVVWKNALDFSDWREGFLINPIIRYGLPTIDDLKKEDSVIWRESQHTLERKLEKIAERERKIKKEPEPIGVKNPKKEALKNQTILF